MTSRRWLSYMLGFCLVVHPARTRAQTPDDPTADASPASPSEALVRDAVAAYARGDAAAARELFEEAHLVEPTARTERGLGIVALREQRYAAALRHLRAALSSDQKPLTPALREGVLALIAEAAPHVGEVALDVTPSSARLREGDLTLRREPNGNVLLGSGTHTLVCEATGHVPAQLLVSVTGGHVQHFSLQLEPIQEAPAPLSHAALRPSPSAPPAIVAVHSPRAMSLKRALFVLGGATLAAGIAAAVSGGIGAARVRSIERHCRGNADGLCSSEELTDLDASKRLGTLSALTNTWLGLMAGSAAGAVGVLPFYIGARGLGRDQGAGLRWVRFF